MRRPGVPPTTKWRTSSWRRCRRAGGWNQSERPPRRALVIQGTGSSPTFRAGVERDIRTMQEALKQKYGLSDRDIEVLKAPSHSTLKEAMQRLQRFSQENPGAEALIFYSGHGGNRDTPKGVDPSRPGAERGTWLPTAASEDDANSLEGIREETVKSLAASHLADFKAVTCIVDSCFSGAWIAGLKRGTWPTRV